MRLLLDAMSSSRLLCLCSLCLTMDSEERMSAAPAPGRIETWFLIPIVRDSDKRTHVATLWGNLREEIFALAGGLSEPAGVVVIKDLELVKGSWKETETAAPEGDESRKYTVVLAESKVDDLRNVLYRAANSFDQKEILFLARGEDRTVRRDSTKGFLKGDPAGG